MLPTEAQNASTLSWTQLGEYTPVVSTVLGAYNILSEVGTSIATVSSTILCQTSVQECGKKLATSAGNIPRSLITAVPGIGNLAIVAYDTHVKNVKLSQQLIALQNKLQESATQVKNLQQSVTTAQKGEETQKRTVSGMSSDLYNVIEKLKASLERERAEKSKVEALRAELAELKQTLEPTEKPIVEVHDQHHATDSEDSSTTDEPLQNVDEPQQNVDEPLQNNDQTHGVALQFMIPFQRPLMSQEQLNQHQALEETNKDLKERLQTLETKHKELLETNQELTKRLEIKERSATRRTAVEEKKASKKTNN